MSFQPQISPIQTQLPSPAAEIQVPKLNENKAVEQKNSLLNIQPKLTIGSPNDSYEQEADAVANQVMRMPMTNFSLSLGAENIQRKCSACEHEENKIQRKQFNITPFIQKSGFDGGGVANDVVSNQIESSRGGGRAMDNGTRNFMESRFGNDFSGVKIHTDSNAIQLSQALNAQAFTVGNDVFFNQGKYNPATDSGKHLLAHELTHTVQQGGATVVQNKTIQRFIDEANLPQTPTRNIMADANYIDNNITSLTFYEAQQAQIHYADGTDLMIGLIPEWVTSPIEGIDYKTERSDHIELSAIGGQIGGVDFIPRGRLITAPPSMNASEVITQAKQHASFHVEPKSKRIVPTVINSITAPLLCSTLRIAEKEYIAQFDAMAKGMTRVFERLKLIIILASMRPATGASKAAGAAAGTATTGLAAKATPQLVRFLARLIGNPGIQDSILVEGVQFSGVRTAVEAPGILRITRFSIENTLRATAEGQGLGRIMAGAYEQAAIQAAKQAGMTSLKLTAETVVNASWRAYIESIGYHAEFIQTATGFTKIWTKVIPL